MTISDNKSAARGLFSVLALVCAAALSADVSAAMPDPGPGRVWNKTNPDAPMPSVEEMRLWSFGDCDNRFPYVNSAERKECVRVVGSEEARDARAYRLCQTSNERDPAEAARCKTAYQANKERASGRAQPNAEPSAEELQRVRAIASAAVERDRAARLAEAPPVEPDPEPVVAPNDEGSSYSTTLLVMLSVAVVGLGIAAAAVRRRQAEALSGR